MSALIAATAFAGTVAAGQDLRKARVAEWKPIVAKFQKPSALRAAWQLTNSVALYVLLWFLMYWSLKISHLLTLSLTILSGAVAVRVFIIMHDCGHGSFLKSKLANDIVGFVAGIVVFTPYYHWRWEHSLHHASSGDLDRRGTGDVWTMTVQEYLDSSRWMRFVYRLARNPFVLLVIAPVFLFVFRQRFSSRKANSRERWSVWWTNLGVLGMALTLSWVFGWKMYLFIQLLITTVAGAIGIWMFYVQHQFDGAYWERGEAWDYTVAALQGSSFYRLPKTLQWFSGNIGFHHIHHLSPRIPNYNLERCHRAHPIFQDVKPVTLRSSLNSARLHLWDEERRKLISFRHLKRLQKRGADTGATAQNLPDARRQC
jgi:omega-6 fatty acid desaturase (delta-12 desaturase)